MWSNFIYIDTSDYKFMAVLQDLIYTGSFTIIIARIISTITIVNVINNHLHCTFELLEIKQNKFSELEHNSSCWYYVIYLCYVRMFQFFFDTLFSSRSNSLSFLHNENNSKNNWYLEISKHTHKYIDVYASSKWQCYFYA